MAWNHEKPQSPTCLLCSQMFANDKDPSPEVLKALKLLRCWAERTPERRFHHVTITGQVSKSAIDPEWLKATGYEQINKQDKGNLKFWSKNYEIPGIKATHNIFLNGSWSLILTPKVTQSSPERMMDFANRILFNAFSGASCVNVRVKRLEVSRPDSQDVLEFLKKENIKEIKAYIHDNYEARIEVTYYDAPLNPTTAQVLQYAV